MENLVIAGSGCAGLTAAIYSARAELNPLVLGGDKPGGQLAETTVVENYPGFAEGTMGPELMMAFQKQAQRFDTRIRAARIASAELQNRGPQRLTLDNGDTLETRALIIATGARPRWLGIPSETALRNKGVSSCATCDGALFRNVPVTVVGGGDSALEEALFLTRFASEVIVIHRRENLRASVIMQEEAFANDKISFVWDSVVEEIKDVDKDEVTGVVVKNKKTGERSTIDCKAVFVAIGHIPNTESFKQSLKLDEQGYVMCPDKGRSLTCVEGVFVAGDCADSVYRQAITAAGMGCRAAIDAERWLQTQRDAWPACN